MKCSSGSRGHSSSNNVKSDTICLEIQQYSSFRQILHVSFNQGRLWISPKKQNLTWDLAVPCVSLRHLLDTGAFSSGNRYDSFTRIDKYLLVLNLARCLFYLYDGPWAPSDWNADQIFFLSKPGTKIIHGRHIPYIHCVLPSHNPDTTLALRQGEACPPVMLSFARLLLEIERGEALPVIGPYPTRNQDLYDQLRKLVEDELQGQITKAYRNAVIGCLDFAFDLGNAPGTTIQMKIRHTILCNIVANLKKNYCDWKSSPPENADLLLVSDPPSPGKKTGITTPSTRSVLAEEALGTHFNTRIVSETHGKDFEVAFPTQPSVYGSAFTLFDDEPLTENIDRFVSWATLPRKIPMRTTAYNF